jgi:potassium/hydrogen antiporter
MEVGTLLLLIGGVLAASILVGLGASRAGVPALVAFLALGMLLGSDGPGGIEFDDAELARTVGIVCLVAILYEGGLSTSWRRMRKIAVPAALLSTIGVAVTAFLTGFAAHELFDLAGPRRSCSAASSHRPTPPPSLRRCASRISGASSPARSRARQA